MHRKNHIYEIQLSNEEKEIHKKIINILKEKKDILEKEHKHILFEYYNKKVHDIAIIENEYNYKIKLNEIGLKKENEQNERQLSQRIYELKKNFEINLKNIKNEFIKNKKFKLFFKFN